MIPLPQSETELIAVMSKVAEVTAIKVLTELNHIKPYMSIREAQRRYGASVVSRWLREGLIRYDQDGPGAKCRISRSEIEAVAMVSNRANYKR